jgi:hypothetical protein
MIESSTNKTIVRQLIRSVISFARENRIHGTKGRVPAISSFSYTLLVLGFLRAKGYINSFNPHNDEVQLGSSSIDEDDLMQLVLNGEDAANSEWSIENAPWYMIFPSLAELKQQFFEYMLDVLRNRYHVVSIENHSWYPDEHDYLYISNPVNLTNTAGTLSEAKYDRMIEILQDEIEGDQWSDCDDSD